MTMDQAEADRTTGKIFSGFLFLVSAIFFLIGGHAYLKAKGFSEHMASVGGKVIAVHENIISNKGGTKDSVLVEATIDGKTIQRYEQVDHRLVMMVGDTVEVFYDRRDAKGTAYVGKSEDIWNGADSLLQIGLLTAILAAATRLISFAQSAMYKSSKA